MPNHVVVLFPLFFALAGCMHSGASVDEEPRLLSATEGGEPGDGPSWLVKVSDGGRVATFFSQAPSLLEGGALDCDSGHPVLGMLPCDDILVWQDGVLTPVVVDHEGEHVRDSSAYVSSLSASGDRVAFDTAAALVPDDKSGAMDTYVRNLAQGQNMLVTRGHDGAPSRPDLKQSEISLGRCGSAGSCGDAAISLNGRYVAFDSFATNLVPNDSNNHTDLFLHDLDTKATELISVNSQGEQLDDISYVSFGTNVVSDDGRYVTFTSTASNAIEEDDNKCPYAGGPTILHGRTCADVFVRDRESGITVLASVGVDGEAGDKSSWFPSLSRDGRTVVFQSESRLDLRDTDDFSDVYLRNLERNQTVPISIDNASWNQAYAPSISEDATRISFKVAVENAPEIVVVRDLTTNQTWTFPTNRTAQTEPIWDAAISPDGQWLAFSTASVVKENEGNGKATRDRQVYVASLDEQLSPA